jgi:hypothetical protein
LEQIVGTIAHHAGLCVPAIYVFLPLRFQSEYPGIPKEPWEQKLGKGTCDFIECLY